MSNNKNTLLIENENLFRSLVFSPVAIVLIIFGGEFLTSSGLFLFKLIYVIVGVYSALCALAYGAYYTNEVYEGKAESFIKNTNLFKTLVFAPLAILFIFFSFYSITTSGHLFFNVLYILIAAYFILGTIAYSAFYTNDYYEEKYNHA
jgi:hypothetical protein